jgi:hypothetical protein
MEFRLSDHAAKELERRGVSRDLVQIVMDSPEQTLPQREGRTIYQSRFGTGEGRTFLVRAVVNDGEDPPVVVTAYRTTHLDKYWRTP